MPRTDTNTTIPGCGFHHVAIRAADFDATVRFYTEGFGFRPAYNWGDGDKRAVLLDTGDGNYLEVFAGGQKSDETPPDRPILHFALRTNDTDAALERARAAGATVTMEPKSVEIGDRKLIFRIAFCRGLDGELIEFFQNPEL
jgi:glyoxylase I family protein